MRPFTLDTTIRVELTDEATRNEVVKLLQTICGQHAKAKVARPIAAPKARRARKAKASSNARSKVGNGGDVDAFGFRKGTARSAAAGMFQQGATLAEVKEELGQHHYEIIHHLKQQGVKIKKTMEIGPSGRQVTRFQILS